MGKVKLLEQSQVATDYDPVKEHKGVKNLEVANLTEKTVQASSRSRQPGQRTWMLYLLEE